MEEDLRSFVKELKTKGTIINIDAEVDRKFEIPAIISSLEDRRKYSTTYFRHVRESEIPVISNLFASRENVALALKVNVKDINAEVMKREKRSINPKVVDSGAVKEKIFLGERIDLRLLPVVTHYERDDGPCITSGLVLMRDPSSGLHNIACYRLKIKNRNTLVAAIAPSHHGHEIIQRAKERNVNVEVAVIIGHHPSFLLGAQSINDSCEDEFERACSFYGENLEVTPCETVDLDVPSRSEIVIEGVINPHKEEAAGPFGEFEGLYGERSLSPVIRVSAISMRKDAIYHETVPGYSEHLLWSGLMRATYLYRNLEKEGYKISALDVPTWGFGNRVCILSVGADERRINEIVQTIFDLASKKDFLNYCIVFDDNVNIYDSFSILTALTHAKLQPDKDIFAKSSKGKTDAKYGVDATWKNDPLTRVNIPKERIIKSLVAARLHAENGGEAFKA